VTWYELLTPGGTCFLLRDGVMITPASLQLMLLLFNIISSKPFLIHRILGLFSQLGFETPLCAVAADVIGQGSERLEYLAA